MLAGIVTIMLARSEGDDGAFSGAAFEKPKSVEQQSYQSREAWLNSPARAVGYSSEEEEVSASTVGI
jgi:hypothetical protein